MNHLTEFAAATALLVVATVGAMFVIPKPKPEPPPTQAETTQEALRRCEANPERLCVVRVEPLPVKTDGERLTDVQKDLKAIKIEQQQLLETVQALAKDAKEK